ncbi:MAG: aspartate 1-decarboxylase [Fimbriimonadaceae bacterium]|nr:aspartate 1-decarboxylase [Fimbriimonadaceae bacterium]QYK59204.1 MAG: aspartate 1-decarboxylase [Fimbriimonadaceae bacterium]
MRLNQLLKAKLHHATITYTNPDYVGSVEIDRDLLRRVGIEDGEMVHIWAVDHKARIVTYAFGGPKGVVGLNGGAAHHFNQGDRVVIAAFTLSDEPVVPSVVHLGENNEVARDMTPFHVLG